MTNKISIDNSIFQINFKCEEELFSIEFSLIPEWETEDYYNEISNKVFIKEEKLQLLLSDINNVFDKLFYKL
jgi:hypothetical protein